MNSINNKLKHLAIALNRMGFNNEAISANLLGKGSLKKLAIFEPPPKMLEKITEKAEYLWAQGFFLWLEAQRQELAKKRNRAEVIPELSRQMFDELDSDFRFSSNIARSIGGDSWTDERGTKWSGEEDLSLVDGWQYIDYFNEDNDDQNALEIDWKTSRIFFRALTAKERREYAPSGPEALWDEDLFQVELHFHPDELVGDHTDSERTSMQKGYAHLPTKFPPINLYNIYKKQAAKDIISENINQGFELVDEIMSKFSSKKSFIDEAEEWAEGLAKGYLPPTERIGHAQDLYALIPIDFSDWKYIKEEEAEESAQKLKHHLKNLSYKTSWRPGHIGLSLEVDKEKVKAQTGQYNPAYWSPEEWTVVIHPGEYSLYLFEMKRQLKEIARSARHELQHFSQDALRIVKGLSRDAGLPRGRIRSPGEVTPGGTPHSWSSKSWPMEKSDPGKRIKHELRDVEFMTRIADDVDTAMDSLDLEGNDVNKIPARYWGEFIKYFIGSEETSLEKILEKEYQSWRKEEPNRHMGREWNQHLRNNITWAHHSRSIGVWAKSNWFNYLKENDLPRWREAALVFIRELNKLGIMDKILRRRLWAPVVSSGHKAWGISVAQYDGSARRLSWQEARELSDEDRFERLSQKLSEYKQFIKSLSDEQLRRHKALVHNTGDLEYWVTPRWEEWDGVSRLEHHEGIVPDHPRLRT